AVSASPKNNAGSMEWEKCGLDTAPARSIRAIVWPDERLRSISEVNAPRDRTCSRLRRRLAHPTRAYRFGTKISAPPPWRRPVASAVRFRPLRADTRRNARRAAWAAARPRRPPPPPPRRGATAERLGAPPPQLPEGSPGRRPRTRHRTRAQPG